MITEERLAELEAQMRNVKAIMANSNTVTTLNEVNATDVRKCRDVLMSVRSELIELQGNTNTVIDNLVEMINETIIDVTPQTATWRPFPYVKK